MRDTPHSRLALVPISLELLTELLRGQCTGPLETNAPQDLVVYGIKPDSDRRGRAFVIVGSESFEPVPMGAPLPILAPWCYTRKEDAEIDRLRTIIRKARQRLYDADGRGPETVATVIRAVGSILREEPTS